MRSFMGVVVLAVTLVGCGSSPITDDGVDAFVAEVQAAVPETQAYGRDQLEGVARNVCTLDNIDQSVEVLDNYSQIPAASREAVARIALENTCAE
jgi:hypothetical protein